MPDNDRCTPDERKTLNLSADGQESLFRLISAGMTHYRSGIEAYDNVDLLIENGERIEGNLL